MRNERKPFNVIKEVNDSISMIAMTSHYAKDRKDRVNAVLAELGVGEFVTSFIVDKGHINGAERHIIYDNGVVLVVNERTRRMITILIARVPQITRYWFGLGQTFPRELGYLLTIARENEMNGLNNL